MFSGNYPSETVLISLFHCNQVSIPHVAFYSFCLIFRQIIV